MRYIFACILLSLVSLLRAQESPLRTDTLETVTLEHYRDAFLLTDPVYSLHDSLFHTSLSLTDILYDHSMLVIKEYGRGMVATASLRGASSAHVRVIWNEMPLNSPLNGQFDLNNLAPVFENIQIVKGGKSAFFGSGSMGGNIILENPLEFIPRLRFRADYTGGQTGLVNPRMSFVWANEHQSGRLAWFYMNDRNRYEIPEKNYVNDHGKIIKTNAAGDWGFRSGNKEYSIHYLHTFTDRLLPPTLTTRSDARLVMSGDNYAFKTTGKHTRSRWLAFAGYQKEHYFYYLHADGKPAGEGTARKLYLKGRWIYKLSSQSESLLRVEWHDIKGRTDNYTAPVHQYPVVTAGITTRRKYWQASALVHKNFNGLFHVPPGMSALFKFFRKNRGIYAAFDYNHRLPAFNDLYWQPGGNPRLKPERGIEWETGWRLYGNRLYLSLTYFERHTRDLIKWLPQSDGLWSPVNIQRVKARGVETGIKWQKGGLRAASEITWQNVRDVNTGKYLIYTPSFAGFFRISRNFRRTGIFYSFRFQNRMYHDPANFSRIPGYHIHSAGISFSNNCCASELYIRNIFNAYYEIIPAYPMPGREIRWKLSLNLHKSLRYEKHTF